MKALDIPRRRARNSGLTDRPFGAPDEVVRHHLAMQAQDYGPAKWSIGQRSRGLVDEDVDRALAEGSIIRTHVLRPTWHFVARDDARWLLELTGPRVLKLLGPRHRELGLDVRTLSRCERVLGAALEGGNQLTRKEAGDVLARARINIEGQRLPHILSHCELDTVICSGALAGKQHTYALFDERVGKSLSLDRDEARAELVRRYLAAHGPATVTDLRWWSGLTATDIRSGIHALGDGVESATLDGVTLWFREDASDRSSGGRGAHLLQTYDELVVGYTESRFFGDPQADAARAAWKQRDVPGGTVLVNDRAAGHWKRTLARTGMTVEVMTYEPPSESRLRTIHASARDLGSFLGLPATVEMRAWPS